MKYQDAIKALKQKKSNVFTLTGEELYLKERFIEMALLIHKDKEVFLFDDDSEKEALEYISMRGLFGARVIVVRYFDKMSTGKFEEILKRSNDVIILSMTYKETRVRPLMRIISSSINVECPKMKQYGSEFPVWIGSKASDIGCQLEEGCADKILSYVGPDMFTISNELKKLKLYSLRVSKEDVDRVVSRTAITTVYHIINNVLRKNVSGALRVLDDYERTHDNYIELIAFLWAYFEKMYRIILLHESDMGVADISKVVGLPQFFIRTIYLPGVRSLGKNKITEYLNSICEMDARVRVFKANKKIVLENFIESFAR